MWDLKFFEVNFNAYLNIQKSEKPDLNSIDKN